MLKTIIEALDVKLGNMITAVGAGGKTTLLRALAEELIAQSTPVIITTTTKIFPPEKREDLILVDQQFSMDYIKERLLKIPAKNRFVYVGKDINEEGKVNGLESYQVNQLKGVFHFILVEGDGSLGKSFKAPGKHEPVIPIETDVLCPVVGLNIIGKPLIREFVHRPEIVSSITGLCEGQMITKEAIVKVLYSSAGYFRTGYKYVPVLNHADNLDDIKNGINIAEMLFSMIPVERVIITSFKNKPYMIKTVKR